jgi:mannose-6-phosphate isomerase-like protein (cupin superfamily)
VDSTRRSLFLAVPALATSAAFADTLSLKSFAKRYDQLPMRTNGKNQSRPILDGMTHSGDHLEVHETTLAPGSSPHPPHQHEHEELFLMMKGNLAVTIDGKTTVIGPGAAAFVHSGELHGVRNPGPEETQYFVVATGNPETKA